MVASLIYFCYIVGYLIHLYTFLYLSLLSFHAKNNLDHSRTLVSWLTYRPHINRGNLVSRAQDNVDQENMDVGRYGAFNSGQVKSDIRCNNGNDHCTTIHTTSEYNDTCDIQQQDLTFNSRRDINDFQPSNNLNVHSYLQSL
jgi:hypothetical protein